MLSAGFPNAQDSLDKPTALLAICTAAPLPPKDGVTQRPLGAIRWLDALLPHEGLPL
jgi:hypothetical protein